MDLCAGMNRFIADVASFADSEPDTHSCIHALRLQYEDFARRHARPRPPGIHVEDHVVPAEPFSVPVRIYRPSATFAKKSSPCVIYMHGGGWVVGSVNSHDCVTAEIAEQASTVVISIDYRLAPEHPFPAAFDDCRHVVSYILENALSLGIDSTRIVLAGDSAGANLAAAAAIWARDVSAFQPMGQALIYPVLGTDFMLSSYLENADAPLLTTSEMQWYWSQYLAGRPVATEPYAAPLVSRDLRQLPPALIMTARHDPVRDDGAMYGERLSSAGTPVSYRCAPGLTHGHLRARALSDSAATEFASLCRWIADQVERR